MKLYSNFPLVFFFHPDNGGYSATAPQTIKPIVYPDQVIIRQPRPVKSVNPDHLSDDQQCLTKDQKEPLKPLPPPLVPERLPSARLSALKSFLMEGGNSFSCIESCIHQSETITTVFFRIKYALVYNTHLPLCAWKLWKKCCSSVLYAPKLLTKGWSFKIMVRQGKSTKEF